MVEPDRTDLSIVRQCRLLSISRSTFYAPPSGESDENLAIMAEIDRPNQVWCTDLTYIPLARGFLYPVAIMDWWSRKVLAWRLSNTMEAEFCIDALEEAMDRHGKPEIFNSDQGSQFTSTAFTQALKTAGVRISMDGKGRWLDNVFVERLWRSLKYECVYLHAWSGGREARDGIGHWMAFYNQRRPHAAHDGRTPDAVYHQPVTPVPAEMAA